MKEVNLQEENKEDQELTFSKTWEHFREFWLGIIKEVELEEKRAKLQTRASESAN